MNAVINATPITHYYVRHSDDCKGWQVCRENPNRPLALYNDEKTAIGEAIMLARSRAERGLPAQVHVRHLAGSSWLTAWYSPDTDPAH